MNATTIIAFVYDWAVYCPACADAAGQTEDADLWSPMFCGEASDSIPSCNACFELIEDVSLTPDGVTYTLDSLKGEDLDSNYHATAVDVLRRHGVEYVDGAGFVGPGPDDSAQSLPDWYRERYTSRD